MCIHARKIKNLIDMLCVVGQGVRQMQEEQNTSSEDEAWKARLKAAQKELQALYAFIDKRCDAGIISDEVMIACFDASTKVLHGAGVIEPQLKGAFVGSATLAAVLMQANAVIRKTLLANCPFLTDELAREAPAAHGRTV